MSSTRFVKPEACASTWRLVVGTIAMFEVIAPSNAFRVETSGRNCPSGHNVKYPNGSVRDNYCIQHIGVRGCRDAAGTPYNWGFRSKANAIPLRSRTRFRCDSEQHSGLKVNADSG